MSLMNSLARIVYPLNSVRKVIRGPLRGSKFVVAPGFGVYYAIGSDALHVDALTHTVKAGSVVYDVGANRGHISMVLAHAVGSNGRVVAFEPVGDLCSDLERNLKLNKLENVTICNTALGEADGTIEFLYSSDNSTQGKFADTERSLVVEGARPIRVTQTRLDKIAEVHGEPDFIKIDVEGAAGCVLRGASATILRKHATFFIELHGPDEQAAVQAELIEKGYTAYNSHGDIVANATIGWNSPLILKPD